MGTKNKGRSPQDNAFQALADKSRAAADTAVAKAAEPDPLEARRREQVLALDKWKTGESGPIDVRNMPGGAVPMGLFKDALQVHDAGRIGRGSGTLNENVNPNFTAALDKENERDRHLYASGQLEENVDNTIAANDAELGNLYQIGNARNMNVAGMREGRYENDQDRFTRYLMRPKQPNFFRTLAMKWLSPEGVGAAIGAGG